MDNEQKISWALKLLAVLGIIIAIVNCNGLILDRQVQKLAAEVRELKNK